MKYVITTSDSGADLSRQLADDSIILTLDILCTSITETLKRLDAPPTIVARETQVNEVSENDIAYILYTSGSTGTPKGVCVTHKNALSFVKWAVELLRIASADRLSNHAGFTFDLSVFDLYASFFVGACVYLIPETHSFLPTYLTGFLRDNEITIWYSVPSALISMMECGGISEFGFSVLRAVIFAGEVFPVSKLKALISRWPQKRFFNFYGPTETNVCAAYEVKEIDPEWPVSVPIGSICCGNEGWAEKENHQRAQIGEEGELIIKGPTVMKGYWGQHLQKSGIHRTGDIVKVLSEDRFMYIGRQDQMVKLKGNRVELGEIEAALLEMSSVKDAVVYLELENGQPKILACLVNEGVRPTLLEVKRHCARFLPKYMIPDKVRFTAMIPRTANGKIDRNKQPEEMEI